MFGKKCNPEFIKRAVLEFRSNSANMNDGGNGTLAAHGEILPHLLYRRMVVEPVLCLEALEPNIIEEET